MKLLALDAATEACSVALQIDNEIISRFEVCPQQHSQKLLPFVDEVLAEAGLSLTQLDGLAFGQGPGSFTGVRIGVAITQGLAFGADLPVVGVSNLAMMAQQGIMEHNATHIMTAIDARMSEIYSGFYVNQNGLAVELDNEKVIKPELLTPLADLQQTEWLAVGTGWQSYAKELSEIFNAKQSSILLPNAKFMLPLAIEKFTLGLTGQAEEAQPNYVRDEVTWQKLPGR